MLKEVKDFAMRGNVVDLAVGFILGGAFSTIVSSLVKDILMPPIGLMMGGVDFRAFSFRWTAWPMRAWPWPRRRGRRHSITDCSSIM